MLKKSSLTSGERALKRTGAGRWREHSNSLKVQFGSWEWEGGNVTADMCSMSLQPGPWGWATTLTISEHEASANGKFHNSAPRFSLRVLIKGICRTLSTIPPNWQGHFFLPVVIQSKTEAFSIRHLKIQIIMMKLWKRNWDAELDALEGS